MASALAGVMFSNWMKKTVWWIGEKQVVIIFIYADVSYDGNNKNLRFSGLPLGSSVSGGAVNRNHKGRWREGDIGFPPVQPTSFCELTRPKGGLIRP